MENATETVTESVTESVTVTDSVAEKINNKGLATWDDATWILTSSFIIFTMQSGFGLLEAGTVSVKNEVNILVKNVVDVAFGGLSYWMFGYGLSFGEDEGSNSFVGFGKWFVTSTDINELGLLYSHFIFQLSFTTTATTIVSGAMAERTRLNSYIIFSFLNTLVYCFPAHWMLNTKGFLRKLGAVDIAGSGIVHLLGGSSSLVAAILLKPRLNRYEKTAPRALGNPTNSLVGLFMLWWGWLAFNSGSTYGISGGKWILAARAATTTMIASIGGGISGMVVSQILRKQYPIPDIINSILGSLVSVTGSCAVINPWEAIIIGSIGGLICMFMPRVVDWFHIDDPIGAFAVHGFGGIWGMLSVGLFVDIDPLEDMTRGHRGLFHGGGFQLLGIQALAALAIMTWSISLTLIILLPLKYTIGIRLSEEDEILGSDFVEHNIRRDDTIFPASSLDLTASSPDLTARRLSAGRRRSAFGSTVSVPPTDLRYLQALAAQNGHGHGHGHGHENGRSSDVKVEMERAVGGIASIGISMLEL